MARSIQTIFDQMKTEGIARATDAGDADMLAMFNNTSRVAKWKILFFTIAFCIYSVEVIMDLFNIEINDTIAKLKPHSARWYAEMARKFQYGYDLVPETDYYDNSALTQDEIDASLIVAYAAVVEQQRGIRIKVAKFNGTDLEPLSGPELTSFIEYMERIKDAGIKLRITTAVADDLKSTLRIYYNPLVIRADGGRIDGTTATPVQDAFKKYLQNLPFNGLFVPQLMIDHLQLVDGVVIVQDDLWQARYGALAFANIDVEYQPDAGYVRIDDDDLLITFLPHSVI